MTKVLPIGSVVMLKNRKKRVMIFGRRHKQHGTDKIWDYIGCPYPEGNINPGHNILFNYEDIKTIFFIGFQDMEEFNYRKNLNENHNIDSSNKNCKTEGCCCKKESCNIEEDADNTEDVSNV